MNAIFKPFGPESMMWMINRERIVLLAGPAAAVLQVAHPVVAMGVAAHSHFRIDSTGRLRRTLAAVYTVAFGSVREIEIVRERVAKAHRPVQGAGYSASDPAAQLWVLATLIMGSVTLFERYIRKLSSKEKDCFLEEHRAFGSIFGLNPDALPKTWIAFQAYWTETINGGSLCSCAVSPEVANAVIRPDAPWFMRVLSPVLRALAVEYIPATIQQRLAIRPGILRRPLWRLLDIILPGILAMIPDSIRYAPQYLHARAQ